MSVRTFSKSYLAGWTPLLLLLAAPIVSFPDVSGLQICAVVGLAVLGWCVIRLAEQRARASTQSGSERAEITDQRHVRAVVTFAVLSILGCLLVMGVQGGSFGEIALDGLQERYIALVEASLQGDAPSSIWSSLGNLARSFFFVAITSFVAVTLQRRSFSSKLMLGALLAMALVVNFLVSVSRLQFGFYVICGCIAAGMLNHPLLRRKLPIVGVALLIAIALVATTSQRMEAMFDDSGVLEDYMTGFFGVDMLSMGRWIVDRLGIAVFALCMYLAQGVPELIRLITYNASPYSMGSHSLFLLLSPVLRLFGVQLGADAPAITNQGLWWGMMGDLYIDFGVFFPLAYVALMYALVRIALRCGGGPVYGLALRALTAGMILLTPYIGALNTYSVSYAVVAVLAWREQARLRRQGLAVPHQSFLSPDVRS